MITEIVLTKPAVPMTREQVLAAFEATVEMWACNPDLISKSYLFDEAGGTVGGVYLWRDRAGPSRWHGAEFLARARAVFGALPEIRIFDTPIIVDNLAGTVRRGSQELAS